MKSKKFKLGLKLWSTNQELILDANNLYEAGLYQYIELFAVPGSYQDTIAQWSSCKIPFVIHAAHYMTGMDLSDSTKSDSNKLLIDEAKSFADTLSATHIIFHPGVKGTLRETARQLSVIHDERLLIENVPLSSIDGKFQLLGSTPAEISSLLSSVPNLGFCLDIVHACCSANSHALNYQTILEEYISLSPRVVHLADNKHDSEIDKHLLLGAGSLPISHSLSILLNNQMITIESSKKTGNYLKLAIQEAKSIYEN
ncbi:MAG: AP endonuclease [uncultured bacterium]|nr:MAG: AP endonuclease [uncultured bacterium]